MVKKCLEEITTALIKKCSGKHDRTQDIKVLVEHYYKYHRAINYDLQNLQDKRDAVKKIYEATPNDERYMLNKIQFLIQYDVLSLMIEKYNNEVGD